METTVFETTLGTFGIGWTADGIARLQLPGLDTAETLERINRDGAYASEPTRDVEAVINLIEDYADGIVVDFRAARLDLARVPEFHRRTYELLLDCGWGQTTTYGELARQLGDVTLSRAVGQAMGAKPIPLIIPCHRVLASNGKPGGFSAPGGAESKLRMLALEGVRPGVPANQMSFGF